MPNFSIIIPVYNVEKYVAQCIDSVINQSYKDFEILVVDDCGTDNSIKIVEEYAQKDNRIKIFYHNVNKRQGGARNTALAASKGKYIVCLDSDDWMDENCLSILYQVFSTKHTESVWFNAIKYFENTKSFDKKPMYDYAEGYRILTPYNIAAFSDFTWIKAYTRESIQKYNITWPEGLTFEDGEFYFKYYTHNPKTYVIKDCLINYRYRDDSTVRQADRGNVHMDHVYTVLRNLKEFWSNLGVYNRYKVTMLKLIQNRIRMCYGLNYSYENKKLSYELMNDLGYPGDFKDFIPMQKNKTPLVSVVVPVYNVEKYISECIESILNQSYRNIEILCIDDCGNDNSLSIIKKYMKQDKRIRIIHHKKNKGLGAARNTGLENARGKYILFVDSDDWIESDCISLSLEKMVETNRNTVMFKSDMWIEDTKQRIPFWHERYVNFPEGEFTLEPNELSSLPHYSWNKLYKTDFLKENNIKWREGVIYEDLEFFFRVFIASPDSYMIDKPLYVYRRRDDSIISNCYKNLTHAEDLYTVTIQIKDYLENNNLMDKYYLSFLELLCNNLNNYRGWEKTEQELKPLMLKCLNDLNFEQNFKKYGRV